MKLELKFATQNLSPQNNFMQGALVFDCRPSLLPVSLRLEDIGALPLRRTVALASLVAPPQEDLMEIGGVSPELGVTPLINTYT